MRFLAIVGPVLVLGLSLYNLGKAEPWKASEAVLAIQKDLKAANPEVIVVGNSLAAADIDLKQLSAETSLKTGLVRVNASGGPTWYTLLKYRVFEEGYQPKVVLVVSTLTAMLRPHPGSTEQLAKLVEQVNGPDALLGLRGLAGEGWLDRAKKTGVEHKKQFLEGLRDYAVGLLIAGDAAQGAELTSKALPVIFADEAVDAENKGGVMPIVEAEILKQKLGVEASFLEGIVRLCKEHGAKVVFVRSPVAPAALWEDAVAPEVEAEVIALLNRLGAGWVDLKKLDVSAADFQDTRHMNKAGQARMTRAVVAALKELGALGEGPIKPAALPLAVSLSRTGNLVLPLQPELSEAPCGMVFKTPSLMAISDPILSKAGLPGSPLRVLENGRALPPRKSPEELGPSCKGAYAHLMRVVRFSGSTETAHWELGHDPAVSGKRWWLYPGTGIRIAGQGPWDGSRGAFKLRVLMRKVGEGSGGKLVLSSGEEQVFTEAEGFLVAEVEGNPGESWWAEIQGGSGYGLVESVELGKERLLEQEPAVVMLLGQKATITGLALPVWDCVMQEGRCVNPELDFFAELLSKYHMGTGSPVVEVGGKLTLSEERKMGPRRWIYPGDRQVFKLPVLPEAKAILIRGAGTGAGVLRLVVEGNVVEVGELGEKIVEVGIEGVRGGELVVESERGGAYFVLNLLAVTAKKAEDAEDAEGGE
jgi:hypothetical protein